MARLVLDDTCPATRREIAERLAALSGAIPNGNRVDPEAYGKMLTIEVTATRPSKAALSAACRELIRTAHWLPSIAEVLQAIREAEQAVQMRQRYLDSLPRLKAAAVARIKGERVALTDEERKTREKQANSMPICGRSRPPWPDCGDPTNGPGNRRRRKSFGRPSGGLAKRRARSISIPAESYTQR